MEKMTAKLTGNPVIGATLSPCTQEMRCTLDTHVAVRLEEREVIPSEAIQHIKPSAGYSGLSEVTVAAIPQNYGKITYDGSKILIT